MSVLVGFSVPSKPPAKKVQNIEREILFIDSAVFGKLGIQQPTTCQENKKEGKKSIFQSVNTFFQKSFSGLLPTILP